MTIGWLNSSPPAAPNQVWPAAAPNRSASLLPRVAFWFAGLVLAILTWAPLGLQPTAGLQGGDIYTYFFPLKAWYAEQLQSGELPLWNPRVGHGFPALGESQTGIFYPFHLLLYRVFPVNAAFHASFLLHYVLAFGFTCHYARRLGFSFAESILTAVLFVYGWFPARSCLEWSIVTGAWIPLAFYGAERFVTESRRRALAPTQLAIVMQILAGHFNLAFITLFGLAVYIPLRLLFQPASRATLARQLVAALVALILALGVAAIQLIPSWELKSRSQRASDAFAEQQVGYGSIPPSYLRQLVQPWDVYGRLGQAEFERAELGARNTNKVESHLYFGLCGMILAIVGIAASAARLYLGPIRPWDGPMWAWLALAGLSLTLAIGWWLPVAVHLPGFGYFTGPGRYGVLVQLGIALLAARGARAIRSMAVAVPSRPMVWLIAITLCLALLALTDAWMGWLGGIRGFLLASYFVRSGWLDGVECIVFLFAAWSAVGFLSATRASSEFAVSFSVMTIAVIAWLDVMSVVQTVQFAEIRRDTPMEHRGASPVRAILQQHPSPVRLLARNQNAMSLLGVATVPVYLGIGPREYFGGPLQLPSDFHWEPELSGATVEWLRWAGITHILAFDIMPDPNLEPVWMGYDPLLHGLLGRAPHEPLWLYSLQAAWGRCYAVPEDSLNLASGPAAGFAGEAPEIQPVPSLRIGGDDVTISVAIDRPAIVILTDLMYPGWRVEVDGQAVEPVPGAVFRTVRVGPGDHEIRWRYQPASLVIGFAVTFLAVAAAILFYRSDSWSRRTLM